MSIMAGSEPSTGSEARTFKLYVLALVCACTELHTHIQINEPLMGSASDFLQQHVRNHILRDCE